MRYGKSVRVVDPVKMRAFLRRNRMAGSVPGGTVAVGSYSLREGSASISNWQVAATV
jgi:hypothetical protein